MQFNDEGVEPVEPGHEIEGLGMDLGVATYDSDGDGVADSAIIAEGDYSVVATDADGDGQADYFRAYDSDGNHMLTLDSQGNQIPDSAVETPDQHRDQGGVTPDVGPDPEPQSGTTIVTGDGSSAGEDLGGQYGSDVIVVTGEDGAPVEVGEPTVDWDSDGVADTAVVRSEDGSVIGYTDLDGDGLADQITQIGPDGSVVIAVSDGQGGWDVVVTGHLEDGNFVEDPTPQGEVAAAPVGDGAVDGGIGESSGMTFTSGGQTYELGEPTVDLDGDGTADTVVQTMDDGTVVGYSDIDGDGQTDQVIQINPDGTVIIGVPDGAGGWEQAATGRIGPNGEFVPDESAVATSG